MYRDRDQMSMDSGMLGWLGLGALAMGLMMLIFMFVWTDV